MQQRGRENTLEMTGMIHGLLRSTIGLWLALAAPPALAAFDDDRTLIIILAASVLFLTVIAILIILLRRVRPAAEAAADDYEPRALLNDLQGVTAGKSHELGKRPAMLGRVAGTENSQLDYIVIPESTVGRRHALIEYKDYAYWIVDQGSINGTYVNNKMVTSEARLKHGDRIKLHKYEFEFIVPELVDTGRTVVSDTVYKNAGGGTGDDDASTSGSGIQLSEDDFIDSDDVPDATVQMDSQPVRLDLHLTGVEDEGNDETIAPGMEAAGDREDSTLQRAAESEPRRRYGSDDGSDDSRSRN